MSQTGPSYEIRVGDALAELRKMPSESVHCVVTSPPYWGLRDYGVADQIGLEATPEEYVAKVVNVFREVYRVLRADGTLWLNMGDSHTSGGRSTHGTRIGYKQETNAGCLTVSEKRPVMPDGLKPKDLLGMPWLLAFGLRSAGWHLRQHMPWIKRNPMPESATDRPGTSCEEIFLLSKIEAYFYDREAVKMPASSQSHSRGNGVNPKAKMPGRNSRLFQDRDPQHPSARKPRQNESFSAAVKSLVATRGRRNHDWFMDSWQGLLTDDEGEPLAFVVNPAPCRDAHFATFPPKMAEPCILAGTGEKGCCPYCLTPFNRVTEQVDTGLTQKTADGWDTGDGAHGTIHRNGRENGESGQPVLVTRTIGFEPGCKCAGLFEQKPIPCTVLDPFAGAGTTGLVAARLGRNFIGIELNHEYRDLAIRRIQRDQEKALA